MRIVAFADTHGGHADLSPPPGDVLVFAGDMCRSGARGELDEFLAWLAPLPHPTKILIAGNHDGCLETDSADVRRRHPDLLLLEDEGVTVDGVSFWGSPWTPEYHDWSFMLPRGPALAERWALIPERLDVLITHGPPWGILDEVGARGQGGGEPIGCVDLLDRVRRVRPRVHLFGHVHEQPGRVVLDGVTYINCATADGTLPCVVVDLDPATRVT